MYLMAFEALEQLARHHTNGETPKRRTLSGSFVALVCRL